MSNKQQVDRQKHSGQFVLFIISLLSAIAEGLIGGAMQFGGDTKSL